MVRSGGFSLLEVLIAVALISIAMGAVLNLSKITNDQVLYLNATQSKMSLQKEISDLLASKEVCASALAGKYVEKEKSLDLSENIKADHFFGSLLHIIDLKVSEVEDVSTDIKKATFQINLEMKSGSFARPLNSEQFSFYYKINAAGALDSCSSLEEFVETGGLGGSSEVSQSELKAMCTSLGGVFKDGSCDICRLSNMVKDPVTNKCVPIPMVDKVVCRWVGSTDGGSAGPRDTNKPSCGSTSPSISCDEFGRPSPRVCQFTSSYAASSGGWVTMRGICNQKCETVSVPAFEVH